MTATTTAPTTAVTPVSPPPPVAHAWCTCYERDGVTPIPSLCGQARKLSTPPAEDWPAHMQVCVICAELHAKAAPCPRCGAS